MPVKKLPFFPVSLYFTGILVLLLGMALINSLFLLHQIRKLQTDARLINEVGIIRGTIQRIVKRELAFVPSESLMQDVDASMLRFMSQQHTFRDNTPEVQFIQRLQILEKQWQKVKIELSHYRSSPSEANRQVALDVSEICWHAADEMAFAAQLLSENEVRNLYMVLLLTSMHIAILLVVLWLNRTYIHNTLERLAHHDFLTKLLNQYSYNKILENEITRASRYQHALALLIADIDHFKAINDTYGHKVGDQVLIQLAAIFREQVRQHDYIARIGGEEFAIIAPETSQEQAYQLAERLRQYVQQKDFLEIKGLTISVGVAEFHAPEGQDALFKRADQALYQAKTLGRNRVVAANLQNPVDSP